MNGRKFFAELQRRNVYKVAVAYAVVSWLLIQIATQVFPFFEIPNWAVRLVVLALLLGFPVALVLAWAFELTPEGIKRTEEVVPHESIRPRTGRRIVAITIALALLAGGMFGFRIFRPRLMSGSVPTPIATPTPVAVAVDIPEKSIAVLCFENLSDDKRNAFFADGVQGEILSHLAKVADLKVTGRTSVMKYGTSADLDLKKISDALGVKYFLEGRVQRSGNRVRVTAELINGLTGAQLWADTYDRGLADVFAIQTEIAERIVAALEAKFTPEEKAEIEDRPTTDLAAYALYVRAKGMIARVAFESSSIENLREAAQLLAEATARDPSFFLAYCQLASAHDQIFFYGLDATAERLALAQGAVDAAIRLRPDFGETHLAIAGHYYFGYRDYDRAREELALAERKLPNDPFPIAMNGYIDRRQGRWESSTQHLQHALELDPRNLVFLKQLALTYNALHRYADMRFILDRALAIAPDDPALQVQRAGIDLEAEANTGPMHQAIATILATDPAAGAAIADRWVILALCEGDTDGAGRALAVMTVAHEEGLPYPKAWVEGLIARQRNDLDGAQNAFATARAEVAKIVRGKPDSAEALSALGMIDAALGDKENAVSEGRRAVELLPSSKDAVVGPLLIQNLATIYAWAGEKKAAVEELRKVASLPCYLSYGQLLLYPLWAPLRDEPGFKEIVSLLASSSR